MSDLLFSRFPFYLGLSLYGQAVAYHTIRFLSPTLASEPKRLSWVLTLFSSTFMTFGSIPYLYQFFSMRFFQPEGVPAWNLLDFANAAEGDLTVFLVAFFIAYMWLDLGLGSRDYKDQITCFSGWGHHSVYTVILLWVVSVRFTSIFVLFGIAEAPTLVLSIGTLHKAFRRDKTFAVLFMITRIIFHIYMIVEAFFRFEPYPIWFLMACILPLHFYWMNGWFVQRRRKRMERERLMAEGKAAQEATLEADVDGEDNVEVKKNERTADTIQHATKQQAQRRSSLVAKLASKPHLAADHEHRRVIPKAYAGPENRSRR